MSSDANFAAYSACYALLYRDKPYADEAAYVAALLRERRPQARRVLELGCGTGAHAEHLARLGFEVHGVDLADGMLAQAQARRASLPGELAARLSFAVGDARTLRTGASYDAVVSLFHVMSYQTSNPDLEAAYATAAAHLDPGGVFVYDHWHGPAVLRQNPEVRVRRLADERVAVTRIAEPRMHWARNVCEVHYTLLVDAADGGHHRFEESHPMRYLFEPELERIERGHWRDAAAHAWLTRRAPDAGDWAATRVLTRA